MKKLVYKLLFTVYTNNSKCERKNMLFLFTLCLQLLTVYFIYADFVDLGVGARQQGLGNTFVGLSDDAASIYYNPAGLGFLSRGEFIVDYLRLYYGLDDNSNLSNSFLGIVYPLKFKRNYGTVGVGLLNFTFSGVYQENSVYFSYGKKVLDKLSVGGNIKFLNETYTMDVYTKIDPVFEHGNKTSLQNFGIDIGGIYNFIPRFFYGLSLININQPNIGLGKTEKLPMMVKMGVGYREKEMNAGLDFTLNDKDTTLSVGFERWFLSCQLCARIGLEFGSREYKKFSIGGSYKFKNIMVNYSFALPLAGIKDTLGLHRVSLSFRFGRIPADELEPGSLEEAYYKLEETTKRLTEELKKSEMEREKLEKLIVEEAVANAKKKIEETKVAAEKRTATVVTEQKITPVTTPRVHIVKKEDTLQSIAQQYYGDPNKWIEIFNANKDKVGRGGTLTVGQTLIIPPISTSTQGQMLVTPPASPVETQQQLQTTPEKPSSQATTVSRPTSVSGAPQVRTHTVKENENLMTIAEKYYGDPKRWIDIYRANKDKIPSGRVEPGQVLIIP